MPRPVVVAFAYGHFGCAAIAALRRAGAYLPLVFSHADQPGEDCWWPSVERLCHAHGIPVLLDADLREGGAGLARLRDLRADFLFSAYFKHLLGEPVLAAAARGGYNLHGSLLPKYRGRAPINWQLVHGERRSGLTLHRMVARADAGEIVAQRGVAVGPDQDAFGLTQQLLALAPRLLDAALPKLFAGRAPHRPMDLAAGSVFGGRRPEDGRIDWARPARAIHDLVRAVAPPWPGAFTFHGAQRLAVARTRVARESGALGAPGTVLADGTIACGAGAIVITGPTNPGAPPRTFPAGTRLSSLPGAS